jgi:hypothetical protein
VPISWYTVPTGPLEWSFTVHGRGEFARQRRQTPWSGRVGHTVIQFPETASEIKPFLSLVATMALII